MTCGGDIGLRTYVSLSTPPMLADQPHSPDFLLSLTKPTNFMRLSSKKAAHAALLGASNRISGSRRPNSRQIRGKCSPNAIPTRLYL